MNGFGDIRGRAIWVILGCTAAQIGLGTAYLSSVLVPAILAEFDWSRGDYMAAASPRVIFAALASPFVGALAYRFGARPVLALSIVLLGGVLACSSLIQNLYHVFAVSIGGGLIVAGVGDIAVGTVVSQWITRGRGLALGIVYSGSNIGGLLFSLLGAQLLVVSGWRSAYLWVSAGVVVLLLPTVWFAVREPRAAQAPTADAGALEPEVETDANLQGLSLQEAMRTPSFWLLAGGLFLFYFYYLGVSAHLVLFLTDIGLSTWQAAANFGFAVFLGVGAKVGIGLVADRWPPKRALLICFAVVTAASFLLLGLPMDGLLPVFVVAHGLATAAQNVVYPLMVGHCFGVKHMAKIYGVLMLALLPGGVLGPIFAGYMFEAFGSYELAFQIFAGLNLVSFAALCAVRSQLHPGGGGGEQRSPA